LEIIPL